MIDYEGIQFHGITSSSTSPTRSKDIEYTVSWIDCASNGRNFARGVFMQGDHSARRDEPNPHPNRSSSSPSMPRGLLLNHLKRQSLQHRLLSQADPQNASSPCKTTSLSSIHSQDPPLDRMYGKRGFLQFQYVIPWEHAKEGTIAILHEIAKSGLAKLPVVLKGLR